MSDIPGRLIPMKTLVFMIFSLVIIYVTLSLLRSKGFLVDVAQFATLMECSNELSAHLAVRHLDVTLPRVLTIC